MVYEEDLERIHENAIQAFRHDDAEQTFNPIRRSYVEDDDDDVDDGEDNDLIARSLSISYRNLDDGKLKVEAVYLDPHDWRRQGPRLLTGVQAMAALSRKNIAARDKYRSVNALLDNCRTDFLRERAYLREWLRRLGQADPGQAPPADIAHEDSDKKSKDEDEFFRYLIYADFPMDEMTKMILLRDIRKENQALLEERDWLRKKVQLLGGGKYEGLLAILQNSGTKVTSLLLALVDLCEEDKDKAIVVDTASNNLKARVAALEAKLRTLETGELPVVIARRKDAEDQTAKQKVGLDQLAHNIEKIGTESKQVKEETEAAQNEIAVLKGQEKKWTEKANSTVHEEAHRELAELREQRERELVELQTKVQKRWQQCEKVEGEIEGVKVRRQQMAEEIEVRQQKLKADLERSEMEAVAMTSAAMDAEIAARKEEQEAQELHDQQKALAKEVKGIEEEIKQREVPPLSEEQLTKAEKALEKATKECKEIEQKDASLKLEIRAMKRKIEKLQEEIAEKEKAEAEAAAKAPKQEPGKKRKSVIQKGLKDLAEIDADADPDLLPYQMRLRHPEMKQKEQTHEQRLTTLFTDAKGQAARVNQLRESTQIHRQTVIGAQLEATGTAASQDYPTVGENGPVDPGSLIAKHDGDRLGLFSGLPEPQSQMSLSPGSRMSMSPGSVTTKHGGDSSGAPSEASSRRMSGVPGSATPVVAHVYDKGNNDNVDLKLAAAQRRLTCTSERLEKMASKEARLKADFNSCVLSLHRWIEHEEKLCKEVEGELSELIAALAPNTEAQEKAKAQLESALATYCATLITLHGNMKMAEEAAQAGKEVSEREQQRIVKGNSKLHKDDDAVCAALNKVIESLGDQEGMCKLVQGCLNEHMDIIKQIDTVRTQRLETREGVTRWGKLLAEERANLQQIRRERRKLVKEEEVLREQAAKITLELIREAQAVADVDFEAAQGPPKDSPLMTRMGQNQSHNISTRSLNAEPSPEVLERMKIVPHGVSANVSTGIEMDYSIPSKPPKGNKKSLFPCLVKDHWSPEDDFSSSVSTTATTFFNTSTQSFSKEFSMTFGTSSRETHELGSRDGVRLVRHLGQKNLPSEVRPLRAGTAEPKLGSNNRSASQTHLPTYQGRTQDMATHQGRTQAYRKSTTPPASGDDLRVAQVGQLRQSPLPMRHESARGKHTDRGYMPEERWARPPGMRVGFGSRRPDRTY
eukprot:gnl/MRDRNA2_/MRDRNA2_29998_c0_seq1.p1 gnl/MRDRNA2_/MRDRNA2_29998_c0~~gnl/MRDRNA2_/MRDRNA2_29998_c0_seq1.p1  ORF type:complete len:1208 (-),score=299.86 gnl/MRDRNA2_/MRDRNA2_29998_c0_seq1:13-3636(-)